MNKEFETIRPLPAETRRHGVFYRQVERNEKAVIYALRYAPAGPEIGFDVFRVVVAPPRTIAGKMLPGCERWPGDSAFGRSAWSFDKLETAYHKYEEISGSPDQYAQAREENKPATTKHEGINFFQSIKKGVL
jgi:hypothetical protein